jgi:SAM-dependent MidA family methyltransferase
LFVFTFYLLPFTLALLALLLSRIREQGALTVAEFMELALYDPEHGYYAKAAQRSGKQGDFYTSVDVSSLFGSTMAEQLAEMWELLRRDGAERFDLVEAAAGNGRLSRDILDAAAERHPEFYKRIRLTLVERSAAARDAQQEVLGPHVDRLQSSAASLPPATCGAIVGNELLDALPVHVIQMTPQGLHEVVIAERQGTLVEVLRPAPHPGFLPGLPTLEPGQRAEIGHAAMRWIHAAALSLSRGFLLLFDYGYTPSLEYFRVHPEGTLMAYRAHRASGDAWLADPGERDITAHVNLTAIRHVAEAQGLTTLGIVDQTYFLMALGLADRLSTGHDSRAMRQRLAARTLMMPGGLGDTMKAMIFSKAIGTPALRGLRSGRLT